MAILIRDQARVQQARSFYRDIYNDNDRYFLVPPELKRGQQIRHPIRHTTIGLTCHNFGETFFLRRKSKTPMCHACSQD